MKIGFTYNLKDPSRGDTDEHAEYESRETVDAVAGALGRIGDVIHIPCVPGFAETFRISPPDVVFNIAEGWGGRDRESYVSILCTVLGIPFSGSDGTALGLTMDKALTKRIARDAGIDTPDFNILSDVPVEPPPFGFPAFVKPRCDGSSRGIHRGSNVHSLEEYQTAAHRIIHGYAQDAIVEPYIDGRDFCIALVGNAPPRLLSPCEVLLGHVDGIPFFSWEYKQRDRDVLAFSSDVPAPSISSMEQMSRRLWNILGLRDYARFDFRTNADGVPFFLEVNALPGLSPVSGIFIRQAVDAGFGYNEIIHTIFSRALDEFSRMS